MHLFDNVFVLLFVTIGILYVYGQNDFERDDADSEKDEEIPRDNYLFVALIDVVFTDGSKRTCTGTIIHDNVVITAAHCFFTDDSMQPELTASFVVIGTKKMYDTNYEQYLPIERIVTHPKYKGWTADLALVYTFAGMMSDKPGRVVRLASEKTSTDSEVTVFSWGQCKDEEDLGIYKSETEAPCSDDEKFQLRDNQRESERKHKVTSIIEDDPDMEPKNTQYVYSKYKNNEQQRRKKRKRRLRQRTRQKKSEQMTLARASITTKLYRIVSSAEENNRYHSYQQMNEKISDFDSKEYQISSEKKMIKLRDINEKSAVADRRKHRRQNYKMVSYYKNNWRRKMGDQKNKLTVEVFAFVNTQTCKKLVEKAMPSVYKIKNPNEVLCYSSEEHYITKEDSGAPAMRLGRLVAVTVGGVDFDGERVAIGMKIVCFCSWIAENLPKSGGTRIQCCRNCCETKENENQKDESFKHPHRKKKRRNK